MGVKRKQHGAKFKAQVALARDKTLAELSSSVSLVGLSWRCAHSTSISTPTLLP